MVRTRFHYESGVYYLTLFCLLGDGLTRDMILVLERREHGPHSVRPR